MSSSTSSVPSVDCSDIADFQRALNKLRTNEDKVKLRLNCALPTNSFHQDAATICDRFQKELAELRRQRYSILYECLRENQQLVNAHTAASADNSSTAALQNAMNNLRFIRNEKAVDEIISEEADKAVHERCRKAQLN